jgi:hypothetical protein
VSFIQVIDMHTKNFDDLQALEEDWFKASEGRRTLRKSIVARDRNDHEHYVVFAFFDSYDSAMVNSNLPETSEFGQKQNAMLDRPMEFLDLDVIEER